MVVTVELPRARTREDAPKEFTEETRNGWVEGFNHCLVLLRLQAERDGNRWDLDEREKAFLQDGKFFEAVRSYRSRTGMGLVESKRRVEIFRDTGR